MVKSLTNSEIVKSGTVLAFFSALLLFFGFISEFAQARILGVPTANSSDFNLYVERGGAFLIQSVQSLYTLPLSYEFLSINATVFSLLFAFLMILVFFKFNPKNILSKYESYISILRFIFSVVIIMLTLYMSISMHNSFFKISSIIQPTTYSEINRLKSANDNKITYKKDIYSIVINDYYKEKFSICEKNDNPKCLFDIRKNFDPNIGKRTYITYFQITFLLSVFLFFTIYFFSGRINFFLKKVWYIYIIFQILFIPYVHGVIGVDYIYPVVDLNISSEDKKNNHYSGLIYLSNHLDKSYFLDRKNYMKIYAFNGDDILSITQLAKVPIFINCSQNIREIKLCEENFW